VAKKTLASKKRRVSPTNREQVISMLAYIRRLVDVLMAHFVSEATENKEFSIWEIDCPPCEMQSEQEYGAIRLRSGTCPTVLRKLPALVVKSSAGAKRKPDTPPRPPAAARKRSGRQAKR